MMNLKMIVDFLESHHLGNPQKGIPYFWGEDAFWVANPGAEDEFEDGTYDPDSPKKTREKHYGRAIACGVTAGGRCDIPPLEVLQLLQQKYAWICWIHPVLGNPRTTWNFGKNTGKIWENPRTK